MTKPSGPKKSGTKTPALKTGTKKAGQKKAGTKHPRAALRRPTFVTHLTTLAVAAAGGAVFAALGVPLGWLSGALFASAFAAMSGVKLALNRWLRDVVFIVLGTSMGAAVTPATLESLPSWPVSMLLLIASVPVMMFIIVGYLERFAGWDRRSAFFASAPGALSASIIMAEAAGADVRRVVLGQVVRVLALVAFVPGAIVASGHAGGSLPAPAESTDLLQILLILCTGAAGGLIFVAIRFPAGAMVGAMLASAVLYGFGFVDQVLPGWLLILGFVIMGANAGSRFEGTSFATLRTFLTPVIVIVVMASVVGFVFAALATGITGEPLPKMVLAFMPGALEAMVIMAFVLDVDPAFVAAHHLARFLFIAFSLPLVVRFLFRPQDVPSDEDYAAEDEVKD
jgi:membrane AbrB-like protein